MEKMWITWESDGSIRSRVLSRELKAELCIFDYHGRSFISRLLRYPTAISQTVIAIFKKNPDLLVVQNPSIVLAFVAALIQPLFRYNLFIDLHTLYIHPTGLKKFVMDLLNAYSMKNCTGIIVTNDSYRKKIINNKISNVFVLPDKIPDFKYPSIRMSLKGRKNIVYICTFSIDEPWEEVVGAASLLGKDVCIYITGRTKSKPKPESIPTNVILTGFLKREDYQNLLRSVDAAMVLTDSKDCLLCGAYEAVAVGKPLILSNTTALRKFFSKGTVFTENRSKEIAAAINYTLTDVSALAKSIEELRSELQFDWKKQWDFMLSKFD